MNTFKTIVITNVTYGKVVQTLAFNAENEKKAFAHADTQNRINPLNGMLSVHYTR